MKTPLILALASAIVAATPLVAQETIVRETTTAVQPTEVVGTVTELVPDAMVVRTQEASPVRYSFTKTTEYLDEFGNRVTRESVRTGLPVTIRYIKEGDRFIVNRVVVRKAPVPAPGSVIEKTTTTTTTTKEKD